MENTEPVANHNLNKKYRVTLAFIQEAENLQDKNQDLELENSLLKQMHEAASSTHQIWIRVLLLIDALSLSDKQKKNAIDTLDRQIRDRALMLIGAHLQSEEQMQHAIDVIDGNLDALAQFKNRY